MIDGVMEPAAGDEIAGRRRRIGGCRRLSRRRIDPEKAVNLSWLRLRHLAVCGRLESAGATTSTFGLRVLVSKQLRLDFVGKKRIAGSDGKVLA